MELIFYQGGGYRTKIEDKTSISDGDKKLWGKLTS